MMINHLFDNQPNRNRIMLLRLFDRKAGSVQAMNGSATLYINGVKADFRDVQNLKPKEVIKIEYFEMPTGKYSGLEC